MSTCISRHGEYDDHEYGSDPFTCDLCGASAEDDIRDELDRLRTENATLQEWFDAADEAAERRLDQSIEWMNRCEQAEARVEALTQELATVRDTLRHRSNALNATGTHNDQLRAQLERIRALPNHWRALLDRGMEFGIEACIDDMHAILADKEPTK